MTKLVELLNRDSESATFEVHLVRQIFIISAFVLFWYCDKLHHHWCRLLTTTCSWGRTSRTCRLQLRDLTASLLQAITKLGWILMSGLMYLTNWLAVFACWTKPLQHLCFTPVTVVFRLCTGLLALARSLLPSRARWFRVKTGHCTMTRSVDLASRLKHVLSVASLFGLIRLMAVVQGSVTENEFNAFERYGVILTILMYCMQCTALIPFPFLVCNFLGVVFLNVFTPKPKLQRSPLIGPFLCFRVVTRGLYPNLVNDNVRHNLRVCESLGLHNYMFEVVTDISIDLHDHPRCRETIVPQDYRTSKGSLFKARALQYALEPGVDVLGQGDWIVHLDEETLITEEAVIGIINFAGSAEYSFGQGVITYGNGHVVNWITTLADSVRVGIDYGCLRFSLGVLHKPIFSWKGSFIIAGAQAEKDVSFDHGPEGSIAEDCFFACVAYSKGHSFGIVEGEMHEKSTFTLQDFVHQRSRWMHGILLTALSRQLPVRYKLGPILMTIAACTMPLNVLLVPLILIFPMPKPFLLTYVFSFVTGTIVYLFFLGTMRSFSVKQHGLLKCCVLMVATIFCGLVGSILENVSSILVFWTPATKSSLNTFYVVNKQVQQDCVKLF